MNWALRIAIAFCCLAGQAANGQALVSCRQLLEAGKQNRPIKPEYKAAIVDTVRQHARERQKMEPWLPCQDLACLSDDEVVKRVLSMCSYDPLQGLDAAEARVAAPHNSASGLY